MNIKLIKKRDESLGLIEQILYNRDIQDYQEFLHTEYSHIQNPFSLNNMKRAIEMFYKHLSKGDCNILIQVDCD